MGLINSNKSWTAKYGGKVKPEYKGSATVVQNKKYKARKQEIRAELARKKQEQKDLNARKRNPLKSTPNATAVQKGANKKTLAAAEKKRAKKAAKKSRNKGKLLYWE